MYGVVCSFECSELSSRCSVVEGGCGRRHDAAVEGSMRYKGELSLIKGVSVPIFGQSYSHKGSIFETPPSPACRANINQRSLATPEHDAGSHTLLCTSLKAKGKERAFYSLSPPPGPISGLPIASFAASSSHRVQLAQGVFHDLIDHPHANYGV
jgi:hypothetical protein